MNKPSGLLRAPPTLAQMGHSQFSCNIKLVLMGLALLAKVTWEDKIEAPSSDLFCISDCATCPVICSPPPPILITKSYPPPSPSVPHYPSPSYFTFSPPPPNSPPSPSSHSSAPPPPPPFKSYTPPSGSAQPQPTVIVGPHDFSYPYYYFYASAASSLSNHAPFLVLLLLPIGYSIVGNW
ncbi:extensin-3-like [Abrus precatorius]|uniref:Extensin-3-like n=1 Tax=Abrus precatorius TaxID=3816 RepID=A0A8B8LLC7_ABRPR|nr:extensin-3-like [Abrus precatorius]